MGTTSLVDYAQVQSLIAQLEQAGCVVVVWTPDDYPGSTSEKQERFDIDKAALCDYLIRRGKEFIANEFGTDEDAG